MSIQFNIMYFVFKNFKTKFLFYNSLRTYNIFIENIDQLFISFNSLTAIWVRKRGILVVLCSLCLYAGTKNSRPVGFLR